MNDENSISEDEKVKMAYYVALILDFEGRKKNLKNYNFFLLTRSK